MTTPPARIVLAEDLERYLATDFLVWAIERPDIPPEQIVLGLPAEQRWAAEVDDADPRCYAAVYGVYPMTLAVPGTGTGVRLLRCAGLTWVGVHPDHRRRGLLTAMMRHHLEQTHAAGLPLSVLHASEAAIYGRYGYGLAALELEVRLGRGARLTAPHLDDNAAALTTRTVAVHDAGVAQRMRACHVDHPSLGEILGEQGYYDRICQTFPTDLRDKEPYRVLFAQRDGVDVGFAVFRRSPSWEHARPSGSLSVWTMVGAPATRLALLRRLVDFDLMGSVRLRTGMDDPAVLWAGGPRGTADLDTYDNIWVRLVDLPKALEARTWHADCAVVADVSDEHAPWNAGRWLVEAKDGAATVTRTDAEPDLTLSVEALGAAYLGGPTLAAQHHAGLVGATRPDAVMELSAALRTPVAPSAAYMF